MKKVKDKNHRERKGVFPSTKRKEFPLMNPTPYNPPGRVKKIQKNKDYWEEKISQDKPLSYLSLRHGSINPVVCHS